MTKGYRNSSPFEAFMLAIVIQITLRVSNTKIRGKPIIIKQSGIHRTI